MHSQKFSHISSKFNKIFNTNITISFRFLKFVEIFKNSSQFVVKQFWQDISKKKRKNYKTELNQYKIYLNVFSNKYKLVLINFILL